MVESVGSMVTEKRFPLKYVFLISAGAAAVGLMPLLGLPGAFILSLAAPFIKLMWPGYPEPMALDSSRVYYLTAIWPLPTVLWFWIAFRVVPGATKGQRIALFLALLLTFGVALAFLVYWISVTWS